MTPEKTQENIEKLARACVDSWDFNDTVEFAVNQVEENLANTEGEEFETLWKEQFGE